MGGATFRGPAPSPVVCKARNRMGPDDADDDSTLPEPEPRRSRRSHLDPAALAAAEQADRIPVEGRWGPARTLLLIIAVPAAFWALIALILALR